MDVQTLWFRYRMYLDGKEPLLSMAYACLTLLEGSTGATSNVHATFCLKYNIDRAVRKTLGDIVSDHGGPFEARKLGSRATMAPLTGNEIQWIEAVIKTLIRRKAEYDADTKAPLPLITTADFVKL